MKKAFPGDPMQHLAMLTTQGLRDRALTPAHEERCNYELSVIKEGGWAPYFLIAYDLCRFAREQGIGMNDGRGSAPASCVCYCLRVTHLDPLEFGLVFERFLNPARVSPPDIDLDFQHSRRQEIFDYIRDTYGSRHVAQIISFATFGLRGAIDEAGRTLRVPQVTLEKVKSCFRYGEYVDKETGKPLTLDDADDPDRLKVYLEKHPGLYELVQTLLARPRHTGRHAAGVVIAPAPIDTLMPLRITDSGGEKVYMTQWDKDQVEKLGLVKFDILGVDSITMVMGCLALIEDEDGPHTLEDLNNIDFEDVAVYDAVCAGDVLGGFQIDTETSRRSVAEVQPRSFRELYDLSAVGRPGAIDFVADYASRTPHYLHPSLEPILADTYGIIVYQEQFIEICRALAGMSTSEADRTRRMIGKKLARGGSEVQAIKHMFIEGCQRQGVVPADVADEIWERMESATRYAFNKSHAVCYGGKWSYKTMWLRVHYPTEFMCAFLNNALEGANEKRNRSIVRGLDECRRMGIRVLPIDVRKSAARFAIEDGGIRVPLTAIKGVGEKALASLLRRQERHFPDMSTVMRLNDLSPVLTKKLVVAGAFDYMDKPRWQLMADLRAALAGAEYQGDLFGQKKVKPWSRAAELHHEVTALGFFLEGGVWPEKPARSSTN